MKKTIILGLFSLVLAASTALGVSINTVLVTSNQLDIPYAGTYAAKNLVKLGNYSLTWHQAGKGADIIATLPTNILSGTYTLTLQGSTPVSVEIGSVTAAAALNARVDSETARAGNAEAVLTNGISAETTRAMNVETDLANSINAISNSLAASFDSRISAISNNILASVTGNINATSNSIVTSQTKNFVAAYAFGSNTLSTSSKVEYSSFIGDWTTNGTDFKIPVAGTYQISFYLANVVAPYTCPNMAIQAIDSNNTTTNLLALFYALNSSAFLGAGAQPIICQTTVHCFQGDQISIVNYFGNQFSYGQYVPTNIPSATLSIIQIQ